MGRMQRGDEMNHNWADQYARQRYDELSREVRGDQLLRMARSDREATSPRTSVSIAARFGLVLAAFRRVGVMPSAGRRSIAALLVAMLLVGLLMTGGH